MKIIALLVIFASCQVLIEEIPKCGNPPLAVLISSIAYYENIIYMFGGYSKKFSNELWSYDITNDKWSNILSGSQIEPSARSSAILVGANKKIYLYGGETYKGANGDLWAYDIALNLWELLSPSGDLPIPRSNPSHAFDMSSIIYIFGGITSFGLESSLYKLDLNSLKWTLIPTTSPPSPRSGCGLAYYNEKLYAWGGNINDTDLYMLDLSNDIWSLQESTNTPPKARQRFPIFALNNILYIFVGGSYDLSEIIKDCYKFDLATMSWSEIPCGANRIVWAFTALNGYLVLFGGANETEASNELMYGDFNDGIKYYVLSKNWVSPGPRVKASLHMVRSSLWLFGGLNNEEFYNDCWKYDLINDIWTYIDAPSFVPSPRSHHGSAVLLGDTIAIFGGKNSGGYLNDMYFYNVLSNRWIQISPKTVPSARASPCIAFKYPWMYIYGGHNDKGAQNDFWTYSIADQDFIEIVTSGFKPPALTNLQCNVGEDSNFYIVTGETNIYTSIGTIFYYIVESNTWDYIKNIDELLIKYSDSKALFINNGAIIFGGRRSYGPYSEINYLNYSSFTIKTIGNLPKSMASHTGAQVGRSMYLYGGVRTMHNSLIPEQGISTFYKVKIDYMECGRGHYGENCTICEPGYYNEFLDSEFCSPCKPGTFNPDYGAGYQSQCIPCSYGSFADEPGSTFCKQCSSDKICPIGTSEPKTKDIVFHTGSQPKAYDDRVSETKRLNIILIIIFILGIIPLAVFILLLKKHPFILFFDIFKPLHLRKCYEEPYATPYGAFFSVIFFLLSLLFITTSLTSFFFSNIIETTTLVPGMTVEGLKYYTNMSVTSYLHNYHGKCIDENGYCNMTMYQINSGRFYGSSIVKTCKPIANGCSIDLSCSNCTYDKYVEMNITIMDILAYADTIEVVCKTGSSIPGEESISAMYVQAEKSKVFNGVRPSVFTFFSIPSVFYTDSGKWENKQVGFHTTYLDLPVNGSEFAPNEISFFNAISFTIIWSMGPNVFVTKRMLNASLSLLFSGILGSVAGLLAALGKAMSVSEASIDLVRKKLEKNENLQMIKFKRKRLRLDEDEKDDKDEKKNDELTTTQVCDIKIIKLF